MMMSINSNPFKLKENSTTTTTTNTSANNNNNTIPPSTIKTRSFIPNENILKKASIFNNINNNNNNTNGNGLTKSALTKPAAGAPPKIIPPLSNLKSNGKIKEPKNETVETEDNNNINNNNNNNNNNNSFDAADTNSTSSSEIMKETSETKMNYNDKDYDEEVEIEEEEEENNKHANNNNNNTDNGDQTYDLNIYRRKLAEEQYLNKQLKLENETLHEELQDIRHEMEELQDQFRLDDADEFRQLQAELEIAAKNCRILQFKLRKLEKKNECLETEKMLLQDKLDEISRETGKLIDLEEELLIAKEVSIRLHGELEQAQEWRITTENLNKELKKQLDDLKDHLDNEIKNRNIPSDNNELVLVNNLYESMFREYFMQEQLYTMSNNLQSQNVTKQLREVTDLLSSYQQKIALLNDELNMLKQQSISKDKEMDQMRLQLKNLKRSRSKENNYHDRNKTNDSESKDNDNNNNNSTERKSRSGSVESDTLNRQVEIGKDEIRLLKNKIMRLEDDLSAVTQERDNLTFQLEKIEDKAMKSFDTLPDTDLDIDSNVMKQMNELKEKIEKLNNEAKENDETKNQLSMEIEHLREKLEESNTEKYSEMESVKNLTDSDKLLRDEYKQIKTDLEEKISQIAGLETELENKNQTLDELRILIESKEAQLIESTRKELEFDEKYSESTYKLNQLVQQIEEYEEVIYHLKYELESKSNVETDLRSDSNRLTETINDFSNQLKEKTNEIEFLNKENNTLSERINADESKIKIIAGDLINHKLKIEQLTKELDAKNNEFKNIENLFNNKQEELIEANKKLSFKDQLIRDKVKECEACRQDLNDLQEKYNTLGSSTDDKIKKMTQQMEALSSEKDKIYHELVDLAEKHNQCEVKNAELDQEKAALKKLESQALNAKYEMKIQYLEIEIDTLRSKIRKLLKEKEVQDQILKENQLIVKEIALKYTTDSETWNRQKQKLLEKEKLYEESVDMRKELKKAADKLRQKLQSLEEQIIDKQNKHTIEKNNWETQRIQYLTTNNRLEEQLSKLSTLKRSKKEIEFAWDKERREMANHIQNLEEFIKALQLQLTTRNSSVAPINDQYGQNEKIQSLNGENEFLKNRIKELEVMLDEMEQVKRFLFDVKEAYDADRHEWMLAKEEFRYQLEVKENLWMDCNMRLNQIVNVIQAIQSNEPIPTNIFEETNSIDDNSTNESLLNNLVGGTSNLLDFKLGSQRNLNLLASKQNSISSQSHPLDNASNTMRNLRPSKMNSINEQSNPNMSLDNDNFALIDITKDRKELNIEFDQAFKKMNRVKDNYGTHKKFMDIVKSKSMKALNRKSSTASLPQNEFFQQNGHESRSSVPPEFSNKPLAAVTAASQRAKSVSKEPVQRADSQTSQTSQKSTSSSIFTAPSRFFSLSRIRSRFSSQPPPPIPTSSPLATHLDRETSEQHEIEYNQSNSRQQQQQQSMHMTPPVQIQINQQPIEDKNNNKKSTRERAMSPGRFLNSLRSRSPFTRSNKDIATNIITTTSGNKSFTVGSSVTPSSNDLAYNSESVDNQYLDRKQYLMSASYQSDSMNSDISVNNRSARANTAGPSPSGGGGSGGGFASFAQSLKNDKLRSASLEYIDNNNTSYNSPLMNRLDETLDEVDEVNIEKSTEINTNQKKLNTVSLPTQPSQNKLQPPPPVIQVTQETPPQQHLQQQQPQQRSRKPNLAVFGSLNVSTSSQSSRIEALKKNFDNVSQDKSDIVKTVKFKEPEKTNKSDSNQPELSNNVSPTKKQAPLPPPVSPAAAAASITTPLKVNTKETKLMQVLDDAMLSSPSTASSISSTSQSNSLITPNILITSDDSNNEDRLGSLNSNSRRLNVKFGGQTSLDESQKLRSASNSLPPKAPILSNNQNNNTLANNISNAFSFRNKFTGIKPKTLDSNDQSESSANQITGNNMNSSSSNINNQNTPIFTSSGKPIQSILRRSETPPNNKLSVRQTSVESTGSHREASIEKILQSKTSTSRPLMFNEKK